MTPGYHVPLDMMYWEGHNTVIFLPKKKKCNLNNKKIPNKPKMKDIHKITGQ